VERPWEGEVSTVRDSEEAEMNLKNVNKITLVKIEKEGLVVNRAIRGYFSVIISVLILALSISVVSAAEKEWPNRPITIINQWAAGGGTDISTRALAKEMQQFLGQPVTVESRPGASGIVAGEYVAKAKPDGYTIGVFDGAAFAPEAYARLRKAPYSSQDLEPVVRWLSLPYGLVSRTDFPWKNLKEFITYVQANPNKMRLGYPGLGHQYHLLYYGLASANNLEMIEVPYKGSGEFKAALLGGHVEVVTGSIAAFKSFIQTKEVQLLAVHSSKRMAEFPEIPTFDELGLAKVTYALYGLFVPKGTSEEIKMKIHDTVKRALETPSLKTFAKENSIELYYGSANDLRGDTRREIEVIGPLLERFVKKYK
jgi:tripartite-type tricarboxylate transporter receptor subunit TctC